jgi:hypothetical protein
MTQPPPRPTYAPPAQSLPPPMHPARELLTRLSWPQVAAFGFIVAGLVGFLVFVPPSTLDKIAAWDWRAIASGVVMVIGALQSALGGSMVKPRSPLVLPSIPPMPPPTMPPPEPDAYEDRTPSESPTAKRRSVPPPPPTEDP